MISPHDLRFPPKDYSVRDLRRVSFVAVLFLVLLRLSIGWQFLYEGLWKYQTLSTPKPWTAEGYLKNAQGPFRDQFREMTGDPDDLNWLDYERVSGRWDSWREQFTKHYGLNDEQVSRLNNLVDGPSNHAAKLSALPDSVPLDDPKTSTDKRLAKIVSYDSDRQLLLADPQMPLKSSEISELLSYVDASRESGGEIVGGSELDREYYEAVEKLGARSQRLSYRQRLQALLLGDPERLGATGILRENTTIYVPETGTIVDGDESTVLLKYGEIQRYRDMLADYEEQLAQATTDYQHEHLAKVWQVIQQKRVQLVQPVIGLEQELLSEAWELLTPEQLAKGQLDWDDKPIHNINRMTIWSLLILGGLLIAGLFTPLAAIAGAGMLMMFYLAMPPFPGVPQPPGPEHSLFVNKNLIEAVALLAIAFTPTGRWFGLDGLYSRMFGSDYD